MVAGAASFSPGASSGTRDLTTSAWQLTEVLAGAGAWSLCWVTSLDSLLVPASCLGVAGGLGRAWDWGRGRSRAWGRLPLEVEEGDFLNLCTTTACKYIE